MTPEESVQVDEGNEEMKRAMIIMIVWTTVVVLAGILLVFLSDAFAAVFSMAGPVF